MTTDKRIVVRVRREGDGQVYSEVADADASPERGDREWGGFVVDRAKGRAMDQRTVQRRAETLAKLMGVELDVDLTWPCIAPRKMACRCPKCIEEGRA